MSAFLLGAFLISTICSIYFHNCARNESISHHFLWKFLKWIDYCYAFLQGAFFVIIFIIYVFFSLDITCSELIRYFLMSYVYYGQKLVQLLSMNVRYFFYIDLLAFVFWILSAYRLIGVACLFTKKASILKKIILLNAILSVHWVDSMRLLIGFKLFMAVFPNT